MNDEWANVEALVREVANARGARWLTLTFVPEDEQFPWHVSVDEGYPARDKTTYNKATLQEALTARLRE